MTDTTTPRPPLTVRTPVSEHPTVAVYPDVRDPGFVVLEWRVAESVHREVLHKGDLVAALGPVTDDLDPAAVEQPTAAQVLAAHGACYGGSDEAYAVTCSCDRYGRPMGYAGLDGVKVHAAHQADMLAAAGLLVTPEHDAQVAARARQDALSLAAAWVERLYRPGLVNRASVLGDLHEWAERAGRGIAPSGHPYDRIERQEEGR